MTFEIVDEQNVEYKEFTLSAFAVLMLGKDSSAGIGGPRYYKYKGE